MHSLASAYKTAKFGHLLTSSIIWCTANCSTFRYLERLDVDHDCDRQRRTDGRTDYLVANAAVNYTLRGMG